MNFKKTLCIVLAAAAVACSFASCGDKPAANNGGDTAQAQAENVDVTAVADQLKNDISYEDSLVEFDAGKIEKILGVPAAGYTKAKVYASSTGATPEEIACFEATSEDMAATIKTAIDARLKAQKSTFSDYKPEQAPKLDSAVIVVKGNCVFFSVSGDSAKAKEIIG